MSLDKPIEIGSSFTDSVPQEPAKELHFQFQHPHVKDNPLMRGHAYAATAYETRQPCRIQTQSEACYLYFILLRIYRSNLFNNSGYFLILAD